MIRFLFFLKVDSIQRNAQIENILLLRKWSSLKVTKHIFMFIFIFNVKYFYTTDIFIIYIFCFIANLKNNNI